MPKFKKNTYQAKFIVFEGLDKSGKDTQAEKFVEWLRDKKDWKVILTGEPTTDNIFGKTIRFILKHRIKIPATWFQYLYFLDRKNHVKKIEKSLKQGTNIVCVRYMFSTIAYGKIADVFTEKILNWHKNILLPDVVIFIKVSAEESMRRLKIQGVKGEFFEKQEKLEKGAQGYAECIKLFPDLFRVVNGEQKPDEVFEDVKKIQID